jgi:hypothetical protein
VNDQSGELTMNSNRTIFLVGIMFSVLCLSLLVWAVLPVSTVEAGLPSRDTPTPAPQPGGGDDKKDNTPVGAWIELQASSGTWSVVQWQNSAGGWEDVAGWQGPLPQNTRWWVAEKDFGDGPFRWAVTQGQGGPVLGVSQAFNLPGGANETVQVTVSVVE